ncbi:hypothetical protein Tco_0477713 [Tanacetum coccineum]
MEEMTKMMRWKSSEDEDDDMESTVEESAATPPPSPCISVVKLAITILDPLPVPEWSDLGCQNACHHSSPPSITTSPGMRVRLQLLPILYHYHTLILSPPDRCTTPMPHIALLHYTLLLPSASHREDRPEVNLPPRKRLGIALGPGYELRSGGPERYVGYGITNSWEKDEIVETLQGALVSTDTELGAHVREFESMVRRDTDEIYTMLDDEQGQRQLLAGRVNILFRDRRAHAHTRLLMETEARMSREAWGRSMDASDLARAEVMSLRTTVHAQMTEITELQSADRSRRRAISDLLETDHGRREEMRELRAADRTRQ